MNRLQHQYLHLLTLIYLQLKYVEPRPTKLDCDRQELVLQSNATQQIFHAAYQRNDRIAKVHEGSESRQDMAAQARRGEDYTASGSPSSIKGGR